MYSIILLWVNQEFIQKGYDFMSKKEQYKSLIHQLVNDCDNEEWLSFTLVLLAKFCGKEVFRYKENIELIEKR